MRHLKLLAAVTVVLVVLSGFSPARSSGGRGGSKSSSSGGHGGGGCSSKSSSSHSSSSGYDSDDRYDSDHDDSYDSNTTSGGTTGGTSGGSSRERAEGSGAVTECAAAKGRRPGDRKEPGATVRVRNAGSRTGTFTVDVAFRDVNGDVVDTGSALATVRAGRSKSVQVPMDHPEEVRKVEECEVTSVS
ncbi:hypothetical protein ABZY93_24940 [Streptomyces smyrnaeus]|uniref:hypothetical protein n=1 Tax=Streptomyces smyrnaeus TaxID=1387713 RepID=UPI0033B006E4